MYNGQVPHSSPRTQTYQWVPTTPRTGYSSLHISPPPTPRLKLIPLPPAPSESLVTPHPLLTYAVRPKIAYNLLTSSLLSQPPCTKSRWAHDSATSPPTLFLTLKCGMLPEDIPVFPSHYQYVTIRDVLSAVSEAYQRAVGPLEREVEEEMRVVAFGSLGNPSTALSTSFMWAGISEQIEPGVWLFHVEELY